MWIESNLESYKNFKNVCDFRLRADHGRYFREHFLDCPSDVLRALMAQYEALTLLKDLSIQADLAR